MRRQFNKKDNTSENLRETVNDIKRTIQTNPKCRISLEERPFKTVPFLGRGRPQPVKESKLQQGSYVGDKKSCKKNTEKSFGVESVDLVPSLRKTIQNPSNLIEGEANKG